MATNEEIIGLRGTIRKLRKLLSEATKAHLEECRINAMGAQRELTLLTELEALKRRWQIEHKTCPNGHVYGTPIFRWNHKDNKLGPEECPNCVYAEQTSEINQLEQRLKSTSDELHEYASNPIFED